MIDQSLPNDETKKRVQRQLDDFNLASRRFYSLMEEKQPFYSDDVYHKLQRLPMKAHEEAVETRMGVDAVDGFREYYGSARLNAQEIQEFSQGALDAIRQRVQSWEELSTDGAS